MYRVDNPKCRRRRSRAFLAKERGSVGHKWVLIRNIRPAQPLLKARWETERIASREAVPLEWMSFKGRGLIWDIEHTAR